MGDLSSRVGRVKSVLREFAQGRRAELAEVVGSAATFAGRLFTAERKTRCVRKRGYILLKIFYESNWSLLDVSIYTLLINHVFQRAIRCS